MVNKKLIIIITFTIFVSIAISFVLLNKFKNDSYEEYMKNKEIKKASSLPFTPQQLQKAEEALSTGITIEDPQNDWYLPKEGTMQWDKPDNSNPYSLGYTDLKSLNIGADEKYLYVKFIFYDVFPEKMQNYEGDDIYSTGAKISELNYITKEGKNDSADLDLSIEYVTFEGDRKNISHAPLEKTQVSHNALISPIGQDEVGETLFEKRNGEGLVAGGSGTDYILSAFPLEEFNISYGQSISFTSSAETGSAKYHHECIDIILGVENTKFGETIRYTLGSNTYESFIPENIKFELNKK